MDTVESRACIFAKVAALVNLLVQGARVEVVDSELVERLTRDLVALPNPFAPRRRT